MLPVPGPEISADVLRTQPDHRTRLTPEARRALRQLARPSERSGELSPLAYNLTISHAHRFIWFRRRQVRHPHAARLLRGERRHLDVRPRVPDALPHRALRRLLQVRLRAAPAPPVRLHLAGQGRQPNYFEFDEPRSRGCRRARRSSPAGSPSQDLARPTSTSRSSPAYRPDPGRLPRSLETFDRDFAEVRTPRPARRTRDATEPDRDAADACELASPDPAGRGRRDVPQGLPGLRVRPTRRRVTV